MNRYRPFEKERKNKKAPFIWAVGLGLFSLVMFFALVLVEEHLVFTEEGLFFDFAQEAVSKRVEPDFVKVPEVVVETQRETGTEPAVANMVCYPTSFKEGSIYAASFDIDVSVETLSQYPINTVILTLRAPDGTAFYQTGIEALKKYQSEDAVDLKMQLEKLHTAGYRVFARIPVFSDDAFAKDHPESALKSISGTAWIDKNGNRWSNPYSKVFNDYFEELLEEYASFAFDGYFFENAHFPYDQKESECLYIEDSTNERATEVEDTADEIKAAIRERPIWFLLDIPSILTDGVNPTTGVDTAMLIRKGIGVAPRLTVSSSGNLAYQLKEQGYCTAISYEQVKRAYPEEREDTPSPLPVVVMEGEVTGSFADQFASIYLQLRQEEPGYTALLMFNPANYREELFMLQENDQNNLVRDIHMPPPSTEPAAP